MIAQIASNVLRLHLMANGWPLCEGCKERWQKHIGTDGIAVCSAWAVSS